MISTCLCPTCSLLPRDRQVHEACGQSKNRKASRMTHTGESRTPKNFRGQRAELIEHKVHTTSFFFFFFTLHWLCFEVCLAAHFHSPPSGPSQTEPVHPHPHHSLFVLYDWECKPINLTEIATTCSSFFAVRSKTSRHVKSPADQPQNYSRRRALWAWHQLSVTQITVRFMYLQDYRADP